MAPWLIAAAVALQKKQENDAKDQARREARAGIAQDRASAMGYPVYGAQAQAQSNAIEGIEGPNYLGMMLDAEDQKRQRSGDKNADLSGKDYFRMFVS